MSANNTTTLRKLIACSVLSLATLFGLSGTASAQEIQLTGPLAGAPNVRHLRLHREGRFEGALMFSASLLDDYRRTLVPGIRLQYNLKEWIGFGIWGGLGLGYNTDLTDQIDKVARSTPQTQVNIPSKASTGAKSFGEQTAKMSWFVAPQVTFSPFRGKLALFQSAFPDTDLYFHLGAAFVGLSERKDCKATECATNHELASRTAIAPTFGLGLTFYTGKLISFGAEYRALPFAWNRAGLDSRGDVATPDAPDRAVNSQDRTFKFNQMVSLFIGFSFPELKTNE
jgi:outer membrane beta-barrel protein